MHGDKYELRVDGMSFSHMYSLNRAQRAFNQDGPSSYPQKYDDGYDDYKYAGTSKPQTDYQWDKPSSPPKPKPIGQFYGGDGDGWNSVKEAKDAVKQPNTQPTNFFDVV